MRLLGHYQVGLRCIRARLESQTQINWLSFCPQKSILCLPKRSRCPKNLSINLLPPKTFPPWKCSQTQKGHQGWQRSWSLPSLRVHGKRSILRHQRRSFERPTQKVYYLSAGQMPQIRSFSRARPSWCQTIQYSYQPQLRNKIVRFRPFKNPLEVQ